MKHYLKESLSKCKICLSFQKHKGCLWKINQDFGMPQQLVKFYMISSPNLSSQKNSTDLQAALLS